MKAIIHILFAVMLVSCSKAQTLSEKDALSMISRARNIQWRSMYLQMHDSPELTRVIRQLISDGKLKEVGALASFADAFPEPGRASQQKPPTANYNSYDQTWYVSCPVFSEHLGKVIEILHDPQGNMAQVTYTIDAWGEQPYYSAFKKYSSQIPAEGPLRRQTAIFQRFKEGWRLVELGER